MFLIAILTIEDSERLIDSTDGLTELTNLVSIFTSLIIITLTTTLTHTVVVLITTTTSTYITTTTVMDMVMATVLATMAAAAVTAMYIAHQHGVEDLIPVM